MLGAIPFGGIGFTGQATGQLLTSGVAAKMTFPGASNLPTTANREGDPAVKPDFANSRVQVNAPGIYRVKLEFNGTVDGAMNVTADIRKTVGAAQAAVSLARNTGYFVATNKSFLTIESIIEVLASDLPTAGGGSTFADPDASAGPGKPSGGFAGAGAAPKTGVYLDAALTSDATQTLTPIEGRLIVERIG